MEITSDKLDKLKQIYELMKDLVEEDELVHADNAYYDGHKFTACVKIYFKEGKIDIPENVKVDEYNKYSWDIAEGVKIVVFKEKGTEEDGVF